MKRTTSVIAAILMLLQLSVLATAENNTSGSFSLPSINTTELGQKLGNATKTGVSEIDQVTGFLVTASPFLLLIIGVLLIVLSGFGRIIGAVLIILAVIRLIQILLS